jgi:predicted PurR-regulated permease PerM
VLLFVWILGIVGRFVAMTAYELIQSTWASVTDTKRWNPNELGSEQEVVTT